MDQRDLLLDRLSELGQTSVTDNGDGSVSVTFGATGTPMIDAGRLPLPGAGHADQLRRPARRAAEPLQRPRRRDRLLPARARPGRHRRSPNAVNAIYDHAGDGTTFFTATGPYAAGSLGALRRRDRRHRADRPERRAGRQQARARDRRAARRRARRRLPRVHRPRRLRGPRGDPQRGERPGAHRRRPGPPRERRRRLARRGDGQPRSASSAPTRPRRAPCRRWTRCSTSSSTAREAWGCEHAHHHRHDAAQRAGRPQPGQRALTRTQSKLSSNREITRPSDDPFNAARALQLRESLAGTQQYQRNVQDTMGWQETSEQAFSQMTDVARAGQGAARAGQLGLVRPRRPRGDRQGDRPAHPRPQGERERDLPGPLRLLRHAHEPGAVPAARAGRPGARRVPGLARSRSSARSARA